MVVTFCVTFYDSTEDYPSLMVTNGYLMIFHGKFIQDGFDGKNDQDLWTKGYAIHCNLVNVGTIDCLCRY